MKVIVLALAVLFSLLVGCSGTGQTHKPQRSLPNPFYVFQFPLEQSTPAQQVQLLDELGYDGLAYFGPSDRRTVEQIKAYRSSPPVQTGEVALGTASWTINADAQEPFDSGLVEEVCRALAGTETILWLLVHSEKARSVQNDESVAQAIQRFADLAKRHEVVVALYPHDGFYMASAEHALHLIRLARRDGSKDNLKLSLHLCHELRAGNGDRIQEVVKATLPYIAIASINGANRAVNPGSSDWSDAIKVLGEGDYDVTQLLACAR
jgi:hypothetical protein